MSYVYIYPALQGRCIPALISVKLHLFIGGITPTSVYMRNAMNKTLSNIFRSQNISNRGGKLNVGSDSSSFPRVPHQNFIMTGDFENYVFFSSAGRMGEGVKSKNIRDIRSGRLSLRRKEHQLRGLSMKVLLLLSSRGQHQRYAQPQGHFPPQLKREEGEKPVAYIILYLPLLSSYL